MSLLSKRQRLDPRGRETEQAFVNATRELLEEGASFAELNVNRIAERAGRTRTSFYAYFDDRRALLARIAEQLAVTKFEIADELFHGEIDKPAVRRTLEQILAVYRSDPTLIRAVVEATSYDDEVAADWREILDRAIDSAQHIIQQSRQTTPEEAHALAFGLVWMTERSFFQHSVRGSGIDEPVLLDALTDIWWHVTEPRSER